MSQAILDSAPPCGEALISLLKEYTEKLNDIGEQLRGVIASARRPTKEFVSTERAALLRKARMLEAPALSLARFVSQRIEHAALADLKRLELRLRLAEFECALEDAHKAAEDWPR